MTTVVLRAIHGARERVRRGPPEVACGAATAGKEIAISLVHFTALLRALSAVLCAAPRRKREIYEYITVPGTQNANIKILQHTH